MIKANVRIVNFFFLFSESKNRKKAQRAYLERIHKPANFMKGKERGGRKERRE